MGKVLKVDLTTPEIEDSPLAEDICRELIGSSGIGERFLYDRTQPGTDHLGQ